MNTTSAEPLPYRRWFFYLLAGYLLTAVPPYFSRGTGQFYSPAIGTFMQTSRGLERTPEHVWIDSRTAAFLQAGESWNLGLGLVLLEVAVLGVQRAIRHRRGQPNPALERTPTGGKPGSAFRVRPRQ